MVIMLLMVEITTFAKVQPMNRINAVVILQHLHELDEGENHSRRNQRIDKPPTVFLVALGLNPRRERAEELKGEIERKQNEQKDFHFGFSPFLFLLYLYYNKKNYKSQVGIFTKVKDSFLCDLRGARARDRLDGLASVIVFFTLDSGEHGETLCYIAEKFVFCSLDGVAVGTGKIIIAMMNHVAVHAVFSADVGFNEHALFFSPHELDTQGNGNAVNVAQIIAAGGVGSGFSDFYFSIVVNPTCHVIF
jgi:hypothetical protein